MNDMTSFIYIGNSWFYYLSRRIWRLFLWLSPLFMFGGVTLPGFEVRLISKKCRKMINIELMVSPLWPIIAPGINYISKRLKNEAFMNMTDKVLYSWNMQYSNVVLDPTPKLIFSQTCLKYDGDKYVSNHVRMITFMTKAFWSVMYSHEVLDPTPRIESFPEWKIQQIARINES